MSLRPYCCEMAEWASNLVSNISHMPCSLYTVIKIIRIKWFIQSCIACLQLFAKIPARPGFEMAKKRVWSVCVTWQITQCWHIASWNLDIGKSNNSLLSVHSIKFILTGFSSSIFFLWLVLQFIVHFVRK